MLKHGSIGKHGITLLLKRYAEDLPSLRLLWLVVRVNLQNDIPPVLLLAKQGQRFWFIARSNYTIRHLALQQTRRRNIYYIAECSPIAKGCQAVSASRTSIGAGEWRQFN